MVIKGEGGSVTMHVQGIEQHPSAAGDLQLSIEVESSGFGGQGSAWVAAGALTRFLADVRQLEMTRQGSATLESISPQELVLAVQHLRWWAAGGGIGASDRRKTFDGQRSSSEERAHPHYQPSF